MKTHQPTTQNYTIQDHRCVNTRVSTGLRDIPYLFFYYVKLLTNVKQLNICYILNSIEKYRGYVLSDTFLPKPLNIPTYIHTYGVDMTKLRCQNCEYEWEYNGKADYYATCPRCKSSVSVKNQKIDEVED